MLCLPWVEGPAVRAAAGQAAECAARRRLRPGHRLRQECGEQTDPTGGQRGWWNADAPTGPLSAEEIGILRAWIDQGADFGKVQVTEEAPKKPLDPKLKALIVAVPRQDLRAAQKLVKAGPDLVKAQDLGGSTALHHAAGFGDVATIKLLLDNGANVNAKNDRESTPLHWAVGSEEKVRLLLDRGADINARQADGRSTLYQAASMAARNSASVVRLLLEKGADPNLATMTGVSPLMTAAGHGDVEVMRLLIAKKANVKAVSGTGGSAITGAASSRNVEAVRLLIDNGADVNAATKRALTPLMNAAMMATRRRLRCYSTVGQRSACRTIVVIHR